MGRKIAVRYAAPLESATAALSGSSPPPRPTEPPPFFRLPAEVRIVVYKHLWRVTNCTRMLDSAPVWPLRLASSPRKPPQSLRKAIAVYSVGTTFSTWVVFPPIVMYMDERIANEFIGEMLKAFPLHLRFTDMIAETPAWLAMLPVVPPVFMENLRHLKVDLSYGDPGPLKHETSAKDTTSSNACEIVHTPRFRFLENELKHWAKCLRNVKLLATITFIIHFDHNDEDCIPILLPNALAKAIVDINPSPSCIKIHAHRNNGHLIPLHNHWCHTSIFNPADSADRAWQEIQPKDSAIHDPHWLRHLTAEDREKKRSHNQETCNEAPCKLGRKTYLELRSARNRI